MYNATLEPTDSQQIIEVQVVGVWRAIDAEDPFWFFNPSTFDDTLVVAEETYINRIGDFSAEEVNLGVWYVVTDGDNVTTAMVDRLIEQFEVVEQRADTLLSGTYVPSSPIEEFVPYRRTARRLTVLLTAFSIPILALLLVFITLVIGLSVEQRRNETAVLRSRGVSPFQLLGLALVEALILGGISLVVGTIIAMFLARLMGTVRSFMDFSGFSDLTLRLTPATWMTMGIALTVTIILYLIPTLSAVRHTIVSYKQVRGSGTAATHLAAVWC